MGLSLKDLMPKEILADFQNAGKLMETLAQKILSIESDVKEIKEHLKGGQNGRTDTNRTAIGTDGAENKSAGDGDEKGGE